MTDHRRVRIGRYPMKVTMYRGECSCGWIGPDRTTDEAASNDLLQHQSTAALYRKVEDE